MRKQNRNCATGEFMCRGERKSTQAGQYRNFPSSYVARVSGTEPSLSLTFDRNYKLILTNTEKQDLRVTNTDKQAQIHENSYQLTQVLYIRYVQ